MMETKSVVTSILEKVFGAWRGMAAVTPRWVSFCPDGQKGRCVMFRKSVTVWVMVLVLFVSSQVMALTQYNDGGTYDITTTINDDVWVDWNAPGKQTTVNLLTGAEIPSPYKLQGFNDSSLTISGGPVSYLDTYDSTQVTMSGGSVSYLETYDSTQITMLDGSVERVISHNSSQVTISGGSVEGLWIQDSTQLTMSGGSLSLFSINTNSQATISGGTLYNTLRVLGSSQLTMSGGRLEGSFETYGSGRVTITGGVIVIDTELLLFDNAEIIMEGFDFDIDGTPVGYGNITSMFGGSYISEPFRRLTGTLLNGDTFDNQFRIGDTAQITLIPEPCTLSLLALGGLAVAWRRRKANLQT